MELVQYNDYLVSIVGTDDPVLYHQPISNHSVEHISMSFQLFMGYMTSFCKQKFNSINHNDVNSIDHKGLSVFLLLPLT